MPFFVVDDGADTHPKMMRAKNAAVGLWTRVGSYVARQLTDGHVPGEIAKMYGSPPQIKKLVAVRLWHEHGHTCPRCPEVRPGDYYMHDYRESGNPSRAEVQARRKRAADKKRQQRAGQNGGGSAGNPSPFDDDSPENPEGFDDETRSNPEPNSDDTAGQGDASPGDSPGTSRARGPLHSTPLQNKGGEEREDSAGSSARAAQPALSQIAPDWEPSHDDVHAAQTARSDAGRARLTVDQVDAVTTKFVRRMLDDGRVAAAWGGRWRQWAENERPEQPSGGVVVPFGGTQQTKSQQQRAGLAAIRERLEGGSTA